MIDYLYEFLAKAGFNEPIHSPITHMPMGLVIGAIIFFICALVMKKYRFIITARHVAIMAFIFAFPTILFGVIDWIHYYHAALITPIKIKMILALIVLVTLGAIIILGSELKKHLIVMTVLYLTAFFSVVGLGYLGAGIIYGRGLEQAVKTSSVPGPAVPEPNKLGIEEKLGSYIPMNLSFVDESGRNVVLGNIIKEPTILSIVYYKCPNACDFLLTGISSALSSNTDKTPFIPHLLTVTIDSRETPADAVRAKKIAYETISTPFSSDNWLFLTGSQDNIDRLTESVGFHYIKNGNDFDHPIGVIILSPQGKVVRYIMGTDFLPVDLQMSLLEASSGVVKPTIARVLRFCFSYNPKSHQLVFNALKVSATVIFVLMGLFITYLIISTNRRRLKGGADGRAK
jgi:protein SCO1